MLKCTKEYLFEEMKKIKFHFYTERTKGRKYRYSTIELFARSCSESSIEDHIKEHMLTFLRTSSIDKNGSYFVKIVVKEVSGKTIINVSLVDKRSTKT